MNYQDIPKYSYKLNTLFHYNFITVATAFWSKYKKTNKYAAIGLADIKQLDKDKFVFVRRIDGRGKIEYERIVYDRKQSQILADLFVKEKESRSISERCIYRWDSVNNAVNYDLFVIKETWPKFIRSAMAKWGIKRMESALRNTT